MNHSGNHHDHYNFTSNASDTLRYNLQKVCFFFPFYQYYLFKAHMSVHSYKMTNGLII